MIAKSMATALALLLAYQGWIQWAQPVANYTIRGQHQVVFIEGNIIRAQRYMHGRHDQPIVFVGSSLTLAMEPYLRDPDVACLAMAGLGVADGLAIIKASGAHPALVMVEINHLQREASQEFLDEVLQPRLYWLRNHFSATRHEYQPSNLFVPWLDTATGGTIFQQSLQPLPAQPLAAKRTHPPDPNGARMAMLPDDVSRAIGLLPQVYEQAQQLHAQIGLYFMPEHPDVNRSPLRQHLCEATQEYFHQPVLFDQKHRYYTRDGSHLDSEDASAYAYFLLNYARERYAQSAHDVHLRLVKKGPTFAKANRLK